MERFDFKFGAEVYGRDEQCGHLIGAVVNPTTWQITDLLVERGLLFTRATVIPVSRIVGMMAQATYLTISHEELNDFPRYQETVVEKGVAEWQQSLPTNEVRVQGLSRTPTGISEMPVYQEKVRIGVADEALVFGGDTPVHGSEGKIGRLSHLIVDAKDFRISQLVVTRGKLLPKQFVIPIHLVETLGEPGIQVIATNAEVDELPEFAVGDDAP